MAHYLDNAATTPVRTEAVQAAVEAMTALWGNPSSRYAPGVQAAQRLKEWRADVAGALGCRPEELFFTSCGTESDNWAIRGAARLGRRKGRHIVTTAIEHAAVLEPVKLIIDNYPAGKTEYFELPNNPQDETAGTRKVAFTGECWIDRADFAEVPPPKFKRLRPDGEVRLMGAYIVKCTGLEKDAGGNVTAIHCTADLETGCGMPADGRKVRGTIHWVSCAHAVEAEVRLYNQLFTLADMNAMPDGADYKDYLNPDSLQVLRGCKLEAALENAQPGQRFQFVRTGYFTPDSKNPGVFNRIVTLKDSFAKTMEAARG